MSVEQAVLADFLDLYLRDQSRGAEPSVEYQRQFPGFEEVIAREYEQLREAVRGELEEENSHLTRHFGAYALESASLGAGGRVSFISQRAHAYDAW